MKTSKVKRIYVAEYNGNFKLGVSNNVPKRIRQLSCGCPTIKIIYQSEYISNAFELEAALHKLYKGKNIGGEWFSYVDIEEVSKIVKKNGIVDDYKKCKKEENERISNALLEKFNNFFIVLKSGLPKEDSRDMTVDELRFEHYVPPLVLSQMIDAINAQSNLRDI